MSNAKRRDNKGRVLQMGESQQDDGRYVYRYMTPFGQRKIACIKTSAARRMDVAIEPFIQ